MKFGIEAIEIKNKKLLFMGFIGIIFLPIIPLPILSPILLALLGVMLGVFVIAIFAPEDFKFLLNIFLTAFILRIFLSFAFYIFSFVLKGNYSPGFIFPNDGWCYSEQGWQIYKFIERGIVVTEENFLANPNMIIQAGSGNITNYDYFTSYVYAVTGYSPVSLFFISSAAGSLAAIFIYLIAKELFSKNIARTASFFAFFWPSFILWSTQNLKEPVIAMFTFIFLWNIFCVRKYSLPLFLLLSVASIFALAKISFPIAIIIMGALFCAGLYLLVNYLFKHRFLAFLVLSILVVAAVIFLKDKIILFIHKKSSYDILSYKSVFDFLDYSRDVRAYGNLKLFSNLDISSPAKVLFFIPLGLIFAIFAPFPWQMGSIMQIMAVPETIIFYILVPFTIKGLIFAFKNRFKQSVLIMSIIGAMLIFLALVEGNSGTLFRHRAVAFYLIFIFTAIGITLKKKKFIEHRC